MANHPRSSNNAANRMPLQPRTGVSAMHSTDATTTAMNQHDAADELPLHNAEGKGAHPSDLCLFGNPEEGCGFQHMDT